MKPNSMFSTYQAKAKAPSRARWGAALVLLLALSVPLGLQLTARQSTPPIVRAQAPIAQPSLQNFVAAKRDSWRVVREIPHDRSAFLQGLLWQNGGFYESTGIEGNSSLRRVEYPTGRVLKKIALPDDVFGEGLVQWQDKLIQITWRSQVAYVWDAKTFARLGEFPYQGEGWGITQNGKSLIMSDGSDTLFFRNPDTFSLERRLPVTMNGRPLRNLNELEWIDGQIWANVWQTDLIVRIDPQSGIVQSFLDLSGLLAQSERNGREDVLNGIAYDAKTGRIWVGGKWWPRIFEIKVN